MRVLHLSRYWALASVAVMCISRAALALPLAFTTVYEDQEAAYFKISHTGLLPPGDNHAGMYGSDWTVDYIIHGNGSSLLNDTLDVALDITHVNPPHGEGVGERAHFFFDVDSGMPAVAGFIDVGPVYRTLVHGSHFDMIDASLSVAVVPGFLFNDINYYLITIHAEHTPEPAAGAALIMALAAIGRRGRGRGRIA